MAILQSRRSFFTNAAIAGATGFGALDALNRGVGGTSFAAEPPPEISTICIERDPAHLHCARSSWPRSCCTQRALPTSAT